MGNSKIENSISTTNIPEIVNKQWNPKMPETQRPSPNVLVRGRWTTEE